MLCILIVLYGDFVENIYFNTDPITSKYTHTVYLSRCASLYIYASSYSALILVCTYWLVHTKGSSVF